MPPCSPWSPGTTWPSPTASDPLIRPLDLATALTAGALARIPGRLALMLSGTGQVEIDGQRLDPGMQLLLRLIEVRGSAFSQVGEVDPVDERAQVRREADSIGFPKTHVGEVRELEVPGPVGPLGARAYTPPRAKSGSPALVFLHGGGWVVGDLETHDELCRILCRRAGIAVISIDYRLAPEDPFPAGLDDALAAFRWVSDNAAKLGLDPARIAIGGDSAGGNLSAVASGVLAGADGPEPALQVLIYPSVDLAGNYRSYELFGEGFFLTNEQRDWYRRNYLPDGADPADPRLSPLRAPTLDRLPATIVITAGFDPLRDEGEAYADALHAAGSPVTKTRVAGLVHGFANMTTVNRAARSATLALGDEVGRTLRSGA